MKKITGLLMLFLLTGLGLNAQSVFDKKIADAIKKTQCAEPSEEAPVTAKALLVLEHDSLAVIIKVQMAPGWHIYQFVPASMPYIQSELILKLPKGMQILGKWLTSEPLASPTDKGVLIHENEAWFVHKVASKGVKGEIKTGIYYQTCNSRQCLPPSELVFIL